MVTIKDIENLAGLARIKISEQEKESMQKDIESILGYVSQVTNLSGDFEKAPLTQKNIMREDEVLHKSGEFTESLLSLAPFREGNYLKVKKILG